MTDKTYNAGDEEQVAERTKKGKSGRDRELDDIRFVLSDKRGRRFYWKKLSDCGVFRTSFTGSSNQTCFNEGQRSVGLILLHDLMEADPEKYLLMTNEHKEPNQ